jgi:RimJ/RimL family protein N-acetyltransferase
MMTRQSNIAAVLEDDHEPPERDPDRASQSAPVRASLVPRQAFLVGPTVYLRPIELGDAQIATFWRPSPFPTPADLVEEQLKDSLAREVASGTRRLIACRRSDNQPIGSTQIHSDDGRTSMLAFHVPGVFGPQRASEVTAEMIRLLVPWLIHEHDQMVVWVQIPADDPTLTRAVRVAGMKHAYHLREALQTADGDRHDLECWQALHPTWLARFGPPPDAVQGNVHRTVRSPGRLEYRGRAVEPPANAISVGNRVYLRPIEQADAEEIARWSMRETETSFDTGRSHRSPIAYWDWHRKQAAEHMPAWVRFTICLLRDGTVIGSNGLAFIDWLNRTAETETEIVRGDFRGGGYGTEAKHLLLEYAFANLGLHMVRSVAWAFNIRSCEALRKQGYRDAGRMAWTGFKSGEMADRLVFDLLASEWRAARV